MVNITYWSDYACPYCYIGEKRLKRVLADLGLSFTLHMKAFQLDPSAGLHAEGDTVTRFALKYGLSKERAAAQVESISQLGRQEGLNFNYAQTLFTNTMDAHRLTKLAQSKSSEMADKVSERLYSAYFTDDLELANRELLTKIGEECGLSKEEIHEVFQGEKYKEEVLQEEREAYRKGIHAVPYFIVNDKYPISGAQSAEVLKAILVKAQAEEKDDPPAEGGYCDINGCH